MFIEGVRMMNYVFKSPYIDVSVDTFKTMLSSHDLYTRSKGKLGKKFNFSGLKLEYNPSRGENLVAVRGVTFQDVTFEASILAAAFIDCEFINCNFRYSTLISDVSLSEVYKFTDGCFSKCKFHYCDMRDTLLEGAVFSECTFTGTDLRCSDLSRAYFINEYVNPDLEHTRLKGAISRTKYSALAIKTFRIIEVLAGEYKQETGIETLDYDYKEGEE